MKRIKIRFIEKGISINKMNYQIQRKRKFFGWTYIGYWQGACNGDSVWNRYGGETKEELLDKILDSYYHTTKQYINIIEYPTIKMY